MNKAEKRVLALVLFLFSVGFLVRYSPWDLPEIGSVPVEFQEFQEETPLVSTSLTSKPIFEEKSEEPSKKTEKKKKKRKKGKPKVQFPIPINTASAETLCAIPGIGPKMAEKIITFRNTHGPIKKEADLLKISGIGKKKSKNILKSVKFD